MSHTRWKFCARLVQSGSRELTPVGMKVSGRSKYMFPSHVEIASTWEGNASNGVGTMKAYLKEKRRKSPNGNDGCRCRPDLRFSIYAMQNFKCIYCRTDLSAVPRAAVHLDHLVPFDKGGTNVPSNLVASCAACNCSRRDMDWTVFAKADARKRIRNWVTKMTTADGVAELKATRNIVKRLMHLIVDAPTAKKIARALK